MSTPAAAGVRLRSVLADLPGYVPGRSAAAGSGPVTFKVSANENPYPPLPSVLRAVAAAAESLNRYPDMACAALCQALAERYDVTPRQVVVGPGSVGVLTQVLEATCEPGDEVVYAWRSFEAYPILTALSGARGVQVPLDRAARHDLAAMASAVTARTKVVLVCSPNNPTGPAVHRDELSAFLDAVPPQVLVVLDEAYVEFVRDPAAADGASVFRGRPNLLVLRTFSKAHGLAGLRVGYALAHPEVADALRKTALPFGVSTIAQQAAVASLAPPAEAELGERVSRLVAERSRVLVALRRTGWPVPDSQANFVWLGAGHRTGQLVAACERAGLTVRPFGGEGVRVTVAEPEANDRLLSVAAGLDPVGAGDPLPLGG